MAAACNAPRSTLQTLIHLGADVNASTRRDRFTPLHIAVVNGNARMVIDLIELGADLQVYDADGMTPLDLARAYDYHSEMKALLTPQ